jgi:predicted ATPase
MSDPNNKLKAMYEESHRFDNFGPAITQIVVKGFRCHRETVIDIGSPITAFCGMNGTGKSTILQLLAVARRAEVGTEKTYYLRDFFRQGGLDPNPFLQNASVMFRFWRQDRSTQQLTISKSPNGQGWNGYKRRPAGNVFFASVGLYLPKMEQRDIVARFYEKLVIINSQDVEPRSREWSSQILGQAYSEMTYRTVQHSGRDAKVLSVTRDGLAYSEMHMGFGEGRSQYLVNALERMPKNSLVLVEEPETSLHPAAQYAFGKYLIDVAINKGHQIFLTTHSEALLRALPEPSRMYLHRVASDVRAVSGLSSSQAQSLMMIGHDKSLCVLVEDVVAQAVLREIVRKVDQQYLSCLNIAVGGDKDAIAKTILCLKETGLKIVAVRDGDMQDSPKDNIFKLPGTRPPELEILSSQEVRTYIQGRYLVNVGDFLASVAGLDHHDYFEQLATKCSVDENALVTECANIYVSALMENATSSLVLLLKAAEK